MVDLRSDTLTKPSPGMLDAMVCAELGDEQGREDPTVNELERRIAEVLGQEEAVYLPTATMGNQIALVILGERGTELVIEQNAHIMISELGGAAYHSGLQTRGLPGPRGWGISRTAIMGFPRFAAAGENFHSIAPAPISRHTHCAPGPLGKIDMGKKCGARSTLRACAGLTTSDDISGTMGRGRRCGLAISMLPRR